MYMEYKPRRHGITIMHVDHLLTSARMHREQTSFHSDVAFGVSSLQLSFPAITYSLERQAFTYSNYLQ